MRAATHTAAQAWTDSMPFAVQLSGPAPLELPSTSGGDASSELSGVAAALLQNISSQAAAGLHIQRAVELDSAVHVTRSQAGKLCRLLAKLRRRTPRQQFITEQFSAAPSGSTLDAEISQQQQNEQQQFRMEPLGRPLRKAWPGRPVLDRALPASVLLSATMTLGEKLHALAGQLVHLSCWLPAVLQCHPQLSIAEEQRLPCALPVYVTADAASPAGIVENQAGTAERQLTDGRQRLIRVAAVLHNEAVVGLTMLQAEELCRALRLATAEHSAPSRRLLRLVDIVAGRELGSATAARNVLSSVLQPAMAALQVIGGHKISWCDDAVLRNAMRTVFAGASDERILAVVHLVHSGTPY